jgi:prepilin-type N-terminal cleavage/methylation domain-containing protein
MKKNIQKYRQGYTLIELSVVMVLVMLIASTLVGLLTQQVQFFR